MIRPGALLEAAEAAETPLKHRFLNGDDLGMATFYWEKHGKTTFLGFIMIYIYYTIYILMDLSRRHGGKANKA